MRSLLALLRSCVPRVRARDAAPTAGPSPAAVEANRRGIEARASGDADSAEAAYLEATRCAPEWEAPWFNLGVLYKHAHRWVESRDACRRALAIDPRSEGALWNLGIAATALGDWAEARAAWRGSGVDVADGDGPLEMNLGAVPIRVNPSSAPEVLWCDRIDPARAIVRSVPLPESGRRHGDLLLHDGEPKGKRLLGVREVPVFEELTVLAPSRSSTFVVEAEQPTPEDGRALEAALSARGLAAEDWTSQVRLLCKACDEGRPHAAGEAHADAPWTTSHQVGVAAVDPGPIRAALEEWAAGGPGRGYGAIELAVAGVLPS